MALVSSYLTSPRNASYDSRNLFNGTLMLRSGYLDQPYCDVMPSGRWICTITASASAEGGKGEHVAALWSDDSGESWSRPVTIEPLPLGLLLPNAYSMTLVAPGVGVGGADRTYAIYNMNTQNITHDGPKGPYIARTDMMGGLFLRYSDDSGASWSKSRTAVPYRLTSIDRHNEWGGKTVIEWTVDQLKVRDGSVYFALTKIGKYLLGPPESLWVLTSPNILSATDAAAITWDLLPDGDDGIQPMVGEEQTHLEEAHVLPMTGAGAPGFYVAGRTTTGWLAASSTADATGRAGWSPTARAQYMDPRTSATGRLAPLNASGLPFGGPHAGVKNPRGPITLKRFDGPSGASHGHGAYLMLYYNNHVKSYLSRDPYWLCAGWEVGASSGMPPTVLWSQPEVILYDRDNHANRPGYPDMIGHRTADGWDVFMTETQKSEARLHRIDRRLLAGLWSQRNASGHPPNAALTFGSGGARVVPTPSLPAFDGSQKTPTGVGGLGLSITLLLSSHEQSQPGQTLLTSEAMGRGGVALIVGPDAGGQLTLRFGDGTQRFNISTDDACSAALGTVGRHFVGAVADGGPRIASLMVDGILCDGSATQERGWVWFTAMGSVRGDEHMSLAPDYGGSMLGGRIYDCMLTTSEMVAAYRAG